MAAKKEETMEKRVVEISDFFTRKQEEEGVWFEPAPFGQKMGLEFKILGVNSTRMAIVLDNFNKKQAEIETIKDIEEKAKATNELYAESAANRVIGLRAAKGVTAKLNGEDISYSDDIVRSILFECPDAAAEIIRATRDGENFLVKKTN